MRKLALTQFTFIFLCALICLQDAHGTVWYVNKKSTNLVEDGLSWSTAFHTVQPAVDVCGAAGGGAIWIAAGVYDELRPAPGAVIVDSPNIALYGGFLGTESELSSRDFVLNLTVIDVDPSYAANGTTAAIWAKTNSENFVLDGVLSYGSFSNFVAEGSSVTLRNCRVPTGYAMRCVLAADFAIASHSSGLSFYLLSGTIHIDHTGFGDAQNVYLNSSVHFSIDACIFERGLGSPITLDTSSQGSVTNSVFVGGEDRPLVYRTGYCKYQDGSVSFSNCAFLYIGGSTNIPVFFDNEASPSDLPIEGETEGQCPPLNTNRTFSLDHCVFAGDGGLTHRYLLLGGKGPDISDSVFWKPQGNALEGGTAVPTTFTNVTFNDCFASGCPPAGCGYHVDQDRNFRLSLGELLRVVQFFNAGGYHCAPGTEDGFAPGPGATDCCPYHSDYNPADWTLSLSELLRAIQLYNSFVFYPCSTGEDGLCPVPDPLTN